MELCHRCSRLLAARSQSKVCPKVGRLIEPPQLPAELPVTVSPPLAPVLLRTMPFTEPFDEMLRKVKPLTPMVVLATLSAVVVGRGQAPDRVSPVMFRVPPPVAFKTAAVPLSRYATGELIVGVSVGGKRDCRYRCR